MIKNADFLRKIEPDLVARRCGGWLAVAPSWSPVRIGVVATTEAEATSAFHREMDEWALMLDEEGSGPKSH